MSNPGVIVLAEVGTANFSFRIEDNIGEAIHIHLGNIRVDLSINDFLKLTEALTKIAEDMISADGFSFDKFDARFLFLAPDILLNIDRVEIIKKKPSQLITSTLDEHGRKDVPLLEGRVSKALNGDMSEELVWDHLNYYGYDNKHNFELITKSMTENGYCPTLDEGSYIVVYNNGNYVRDGCHRASISQYLNGDVEVDVANIITKREISNEVVNSRIYEMEESYRNAVLSKRRELVAYYVKKDLAGKRIIIKGAGEHTRHLLDLCGDGLDVVGILDNDASIGFRYGYRVLDDDDVSKKVGDIILISSFRYRYEMRLEMERKPYAKHYVIYDLYDNGIEGEFF